MCLGLPDGLPDLRGSSTYCIRDKEEAGGAGGGHKNDERDFVYYLQVKFS